MSPDGTAGPNGTTPTSGIRNSARNGTKGGDAGRGERATLEEKARRRAMLIRAGIYIFATHLFAGFVLLLFALGDRK